VDGEDQTQGQVNLKDPLPEEDLPNVRVISATFPVINLAFARFSCWLDFALY
jgi:hypothetical protein